VSDGLAETMLRFVQHIEIYDVIKIKSNEVCVESDGNSRGKRTRDLQSSHHAGVANTRVPPSQEKGRYIRQTLDRVN
jgi:hypothetical protein